MFSIMCASSLKHVYVVPYRSDTIFLATGFDGIGDGADDGMNGCDCNHRGGVPGFVQV